MTVHSQMPGNPGLVHIVDDEEPLRQALARIIGKAGWATQTYESGNEFLKQLEDVHPACVVLDLLMPGATGMEVQQELIARSIDIPVIFLTGQGTIMAATTALLTGAVDFLVKPVKTEILLQRIDSALKEDIRRVELATCRRRIASLSVREHEICGLLVRGLGSKQIAQELSLSVRTVEHHRERILKKTETANTAELASLLALARGTQAESN